MSAEGSISIDENLSESSFGQEEIMDDAVEAKDIKTPKFPTLSLCLDFSFGDHIEIQSLTPVPHYAANDLLT